MQIRDILHVALVLPALAAAARPTAAQVTPYGSGINPPGSLVLTHGIPMVGHTFRVGVSNTATDAAPSALAYLSIASAPDPAFPAGNVLPGYGLLAPGSDGEVLLSFAAPNPLLTVGPLVWGGGTAPPALFSLSIPPVPALSGATIYLQGSLLDPVGIPSLGVTNGLAVTLAAPDFPGLVLIQPGTFQMGSVAPAGPPYHGNAQHKPVHQVTITKPFWMGRYEVTQAEYLPMMAQNPSWTVGPNNPVDNVSWYEAIKYCELLTYDAGMRGELPVGYQYRLPTEAEWEYACRAGTTTEFHTGAELHCDEARIRFAGHTSPATDCNYPFGTVPVGSYAPNAWGLYDMHGNVWEWCLDGWTDTYTPGPKVDPYQTGQSAWRVFRGGAWLYGSSACRSAFRSEYEPLYISSLSGFRVVLAPALVP